MARGTRLRYYHCVTARSPFAHERFSLPPPPGGGDSLHVATGAIPSAPRHGLFQSTADWLKVTLASIGATSTINPESYAYYPSPYIVP